MKCPRPAYKKAALANVKVDTSTVVIANVTLQAGDVATEVTATTSQSLRRSDLLRLIRLAGREPLERDTLYHPVTRTESAFTVLV